jgi:hypothetical protein
MKITYYEYETNWGIVVIIVAILMVIVLMSFAHGYSDDHCVLYTDKHLLITRVPGFVNNLGIDTNHICTKVIGEIIENGWQPVSSNDDNCFGYTSLDAQSCMWFWKK